ncbi:transmembrane protein 170B isoform X2 [Marmota monax]|uniref:transmembrane protein 170B isoform X2 n=1 Tax=Marmota monax TaxID=9995 RepID=UPI001EAF8E6E|nr:transmembrane protein 170B isoform X2 [Marmota monax]
MSPRRGGGCLGDTLSGPPQRLVGGSSSAQPGAPQPPPAAAAWRSRAPAAAPRASQPPPPGAPGEGGGRPPGKMKAEGGDHSMINLSVQQVLSLWAHGTVLRNLTEMWYWIFLWALFSSLFVHGAAGVLMFVMLQRHRQGRVISVIAVSIGFLASVTGAMITRNRAGAIEDPVGHLPSCNQDSGLNFVKNGSAVLGASWMQKLRARSCPLRPLSLLIKDTFPKDKYKRWHVPPLATMTTVILTCARVFVTYGDLHPKVHLIQRTQGFSLATCLPETEVTYAALP